MGMGVGFAGPPGSQQYETLTWFSLFIFGLGTQLDRMKKKNGWIPAGLGCCDHPWLS